MFKYHTILEITFHYFIEKSPCKKKKCQKTNLDQNIVLKRFSLTVAGKPNNSYFALS